MEPERTLSEAMAKAAGPARAVAVAFLEHDLGFLRRLDTLLGESFGRLLDVARTAPFPARGRIENARLALCKIREPLLMRAVSELEQALADLKEEAT